jgi:hypothetical protein
MANAGASAIDINPVNNEDTSGQIARSSDHIGPASGFGDQIEQLKTEIRRLKHQNREIIKSMAVLTSLCAELTAWLDSQRAPLATLNSVAMGHDKAIVELGTALDTVITNLNHVSKIVNQRVLGNYE